MSKEPTYEQALNHLYSLALEANVPNKVHKSSEQCFEILKKALNKDPKKVAPLKEAK